MLSDIRQRTKPVLAALLALVLLAGLAACAETEPVEDPAAAEEEAQELEPTPEADSDEVELEDTEDDMPRDPEVRVTRVIDGDTIEVLLRGETVKVRLIGIDTPETVHPTKPVECFGQEASAFTKRNLDGETVTLEFDVQRTDRYQRTLAYVWLGDRMFNQVLVRRGYAHVSTYPPNVKYQQRFLRAQRKARRSDAGLWGACPVGGEQAGAASGKRCDPAYPDVCIPPPPPDLNCPDIPHRNFRVLPPDPHRFDGDGDGMGCET